MGSDDKERLHWAASAPQRANDSALFLALAEEFDRAVAAHASKATNIPLGQWLASAVAYSTREPWPTVRSAIARQVGGG